jgi:hypothetical protein
MAAGTAASPARSFLLRAFRPLSLDLSSVDAANRNRLKHTSLFDNFNYVKLSFVFCPVSMFKPRRDSLQTPSNRIVALPITDAAAINARVPRNEKTRLIRLRIGGLWVNLATEQT